MTDVQRSADKDVSVTLPGVIFDSDLSAGVLSCAEAMVLLQQVTTLENDWLLFVQRCAPWLDHFCSSGKAIPEEFFDGYHRLHRAKQAICTALSFVVPPPSFVQGQSELFWHVPPAENPVGDFKSCCQQLVQLTREYEQLLQERQQHLHFFVSLARTVSSDEPELHASLKHLISLLNPVGHDPAGHRDCTEEFSASPAPDDEVACGARSLVLLILDAEQRERSDSEDMPSSLPFAGATKIALSPLNSETRRDHFNRVDTAFGRTIAIEALRGSLSLSRDSVRCLSSDSAVTPEEARDLNSKERAEDDDSNPPRKAASDDPVTAAQWRTLHNRFNEKPLAAMPGLAKPRSKPHPEAIAAERQVTGEQILAAAKRLREKADKLTAMTDNGNSSNLSISSLDPGKVTRAGGFRNLASLLEHCVEVLNARSDQRNTFRKELHAALTLLSKVQNAVRTEYENNRLDKSSISEQELALQWLKCFVQDPRERFAEDNYMKKGVTASPRKYKEMQSEIHQLRQAWEKDRWADELLRKMHQSGQRILMQDALDLDAWTEISEWTKEFMRCGRKPSDPQLREVLLHLLDRVPDTNLPVSECQEHPVFELSQELELAIDHTRDFIVEKSRQRHQPSIANQEEKLSEDTLLVAELLNGKRMVLVGGGPKKHANDRIQRDLKLQDIKWLSAHSKDRLDRFRPDVSNADIVILLTGFMAHMHTEIKEYCSKAGVMCVLMKQQAGYGVNQISRAILEQCGDQLQRMKNTA